MSPNADPPQSDVAASNSTAMPRFSSLEWTFTQRLKFAEDSISLIIFGSGPYIYWFLEEGPAHMESATFEAQLCVFEGTATFVRGAANLSNKAVLIWGDSYIAHIPIDQLMEGGTVCQLNVLSTGRPIVSIRAFHTCFPLASFEVYFADGIIQKMTYDVQSDGRPVIAAKERFRLPVRPEETVTTAYTRSARTYLGTSEGRLIAIKDMLLISIIEPGPSNSIMQITQLTSSDMTLLLYDNGSILSYRDKNCKTELPGRYTRISEASFEIEAIDSINAKEKYILAGDRDGSLTAFRIIKGKLEIYRARRSLCFNKITLIEFISQTKFIIGTEMGELQWFDVTQLAQYDNCDIAPPCVINCERRYRTIAGWFFLQDDKLTRAFKLCKKHKMKKRKLDLQWQRENMKVKYLSCSGVPDREIIFAYTEDEYFLNITDFSTLKGHDVELVDVPVDDHTTGKRAVIDQVFLMPSYILIQLVSKATKLYHSDLENDGMYRLATIIVECRIVAATCIEKSDPKRPSINLLDVLYAYDDGSFGGLSIEWKSGHSVEENVVSCNFSVDLRGSHVISMIASKEHIGNLQCILLSHKGIAHLVAKKFRLGEGPVEYMDVAQQDLSGVIGRGHSLMETSQGILAIGFKQDTLHVCRISMSVDKSPQYNHIFSVETLNSRLPFTVIEDKVPQHDGTRVTDYQLIVSYCHKDGMKEDHFAFLVPEMIEGFRHSGIITSLLIRNDLKDGKEYLYTGDTSGKFCIWAQDNKSLNGQLYVTDFTLNGAVTDSRRFGDYIAVSTSQGDLHLYIATSIPRTQVLPMIPYNMGQKINCMKNVTFAKDPLHYLIVFLEDGSVMELKVDNKKEETLSVADMIEQKKVSKFPTATKSVSITPHGGKSYIIALGVDNLLRRTQYPQIGNQGVQMNWKISIFISFPRGSQHLLMVGDPCGWLYFILSNEKAAPWFYIDQYHKCEIIGITYCATNDNFFLISLDISGIVVIRQPFKKTRNEDLMIWTCPVPSPRKIGVTAQKEIIVIGKGVATRKI